MATFKFYQDVQVVRKYRYHYEIEAESLEEARAKAAEVSNLEDCEDAEYIDSEDLFSEMDDIYAFQNPDIIGIYDEDGNEQDEWEDLI